MRAPRGVVSDPTEPKLEKFKTLKNETLGVRTICSRSLIGHAMTASKSLYHGLPAGFVIVESGVPPLMVAPKETN